MADGIASKANSLGGSIPLAGTNLVLVSTMKKFAGGFFLGLVVMLAVGAMMDDSVRRIADTLVKMQYSLEIISQQRSR